MTEFNFISIFLAELVQ